MALQLQDGTDLLLQDGAALELQAEAADPLSVSGPANWSGYSGQQAQFFVEASDGTEPYTYQWYETTEGLLAGAVFDYLHINTSLSDNGKSYYCIVNDEVGTPVQSDTATLTVQAQPNEVVLDTYIKNDVGEWVSLSGQDADPTDLIDDSTISLLLTWSSQKIQNELDAKLSISDYDPYKAKWRSPYTPGQSMRFNDMVLDDGWLMIANKDTSDPAAPDRVGAPVDVYQGTILETNQLAAQIIFGNRYTIGDTGYINSYRVYVVTGNVYRVYSIANPTTNPQLTELGLFTAPSTGWLTFTITPVFVTPGFVFDMIAVAQEPDPSPTVVLANYNYQTPQNPATPVAGDIQHSRGQPDVMSVSYTDSDTTDRTALIQSLSVGDIIDGAGQRWAVQANADQGTYANISVTPALVGAPIGIQQFGFETVTPTPIAYAYDTDYWSLNSIPAQGLLGVDTAYADIVPDNTAYGTDISVQAAVVSPDWDVMAITDSVGGPSGSGDGLARITQQLQYAPVENGFVDRNDSTISFDDVTRTFTISPTDIAYVYFHNRDVYITIDTKSVVIPDAEGLYYIYFDEDTLVQTGTFTENIITDYAFVAVVYWDADNSESIFVGEERHGNTMDSTTHSYNHLTLGARYQSGLGLGDMDVDGNGNDASAAQFSVADGFIWDEDIQHHIQDGLPQTLSAIAEIPMFYRNGANGLWRKATATQYPITTTGTGRPAWNEWTGTAWQLTEVAANDFALTHYYATNDINNPVIGIVGQADYASLALAQTAAPEEINNLAYGPLGTLTPEFVPIATVIWETRTSYGNAVKARIRSTEDGKDYIDWRFRRGGVAASV